MLTSRSRRPAAGFASGGGGAAASQEPQQRAVVCSTRGCSCSHVPGEPQSVVGCILHRHRLVAASSRNWLNGKCAFCDPSLVSDAAPPRPRAFGKDEGAAAAKGVMLPIRRSKWETQYYEAEAKRKEAEKRQQRIEDILVAKRAHLEEAEARATASAVAQHAAEKAELVWKRRFEEEQAARLAIEAIRDDLVATRDTAVADAAEAAERATMAEEAAGRCRGLWVAASWRCAFDRKRRDEARAAATAATVAREQAELASAADRQARLNAEELSRTDKLEREQAEQRALVDRQGRVEAQQLAAAEAKERMELVEKLARATEAEVVATRAAEESATAVTSAEARAAAAEAAEKASVDAANEANARCNAAETEAATSALEVVRLMGLLGEAGTAEEEAAAAQKRAKAAMEAEIETERGLRKEVGARLLEAKEACQTLQVRADEAAKASWQIAMLRTQIDVLRKANEVAEQQGSAATEAREQAEVRLREAVTRTSAAELSVQRAEDDAAAARAELAPLKVQAAEAVAVAEAAEARCQEEMQLRLAAEGERRRRVERVRLARENSQGGGGDAQGGGGGLGRNSYMQKARKKKLEKAVSTFIAARLLRMPKGHKKPRFAFQVDLDVEALNHQECFVLDMGDKVRNNPVRLFLPSIPTTMINLPRQARDKRRENSQKEAFSRRSTSSWARLRARLIKLPRQTLLTIWRRRRTVRRLWKTPTSEYLPTHSLCSRFFLCPTRWCASKLSRAAGPFYVCHPDISGSC